MCIRDRYCSVDSVIMNDPVKKMNLQLEYLNCVTLSGIPPHKLILKVGAIIMLIRNMKLDSCLVNGARIVVCGLMKNAVNLDVLTGLVGGNIVFVPRIKLILTDPCHFLCQGAVPIKSSSCYYLK